MKDRIIYMSKIILLLFLSITSSCLQVVPQKTHLAHFVEWATAYSIKYENSQIWLYRLKVFISNLIKVKMHNIQYDKGETGYLMQLNKFGDLTPQQFTSRYTSKFSIQYIKMNFTTNCNGTVFDAPNPPLELDWTIKAVTPVQDQQSCSSSWAFTAVGAVEGLYALKKGKLQKFSQQQLIDCSGQYGNEGCNGGFMDQAFWYIIDNGITSNITYNYTTKANRCKYVPSMKITSFGKCARVPSRNYSKLLSAIVQQPTSVAVDASEMQLYSSGIFDGKCSGQLNRGMLLVGYGNNNGSLYWRLKNSLGVKWGDQGYISIHRTEKDDDGSCGIQLAASIPQNIV